MTVKSTNKIILCTQRITVEKNTDEIFGEILVNYYDDVIMELNSFGIYYYYMWAGYYR